jgi:prevent-host-death family protein
MNVKTINSTEAQNNFGQLLDDVAENNVRYLIQRFGKIKAAVIPLEDFRRLIIQHNEAIQLLREVSPEYTLGQQQNEAFIQKLIEDEQNK